VLWTDTYGYNADNQMTCVSSTASNPCTASDTNRKASFVYDGDGTRVKSTIGSIITVYSGNSFEWTTDNTDPNHPVTTPTRYYFQGSTRLAQRSGTGLYDDYQWFLDDYLGGTNMIVQNAGTPTTAVAQMRYTPFGSKDTTYTTSGTLPTAYLYTGQQSEGDSLSGIYFYNARYYDPSLGRFLQADTIIPQSQGVQAFDRYAYVNNNPLHCS
jgi:RHS repeat-associated protein